MATTGWTPQLARMHCFVWGSGWTGPSWEMRLDLPGHIILAFILPIHVYKLTGVHWLAPQSGNQLCFSSVHGPTGFLRRTPTHDEHGGC